MFGYSENAKMASISLSCLNSFKCISNEFKYIQTIHSVYINFVGKACKYR